MRKDDAVSIDHSSSVLNPEYEPEGEAYWMVRQVGLDIKTNGERLKPHEVRFAERMIGLGQVIEWISRGEPDASGALMPSNDFIWISHGFAVCELKSTTLRYKTIKERLRDAVAKAEVKGFVKDRFVIDLGVRQLPDSLKRALEKFNLRTEGSRIKQLWVMSRDGGRLEEIHLRA